MRPPLRQSSTSTQINMTPMIDVTFLLIIFFLLSSHLAQQESQLEIKLPEASSGQQSVDSTERPRLSVNLLPDGSIMLGSTETSTDQMSTRLRIECEKLGPDMEVRIRADRGVAYRAVEPILLACAEAGIWNVTFAVFEKE